MLIKYQPLKDRKALFDYYKQIKSSIPYWQDAFFEIWEKSMFDDKNPEDEALFKELHTWTAQKGGKIIGFIQFGIPHYIYKQNGEKDFDTIAGIIRNLYFDENVAFVAEELINAAHNYFNNQKVKKQFAFFHAFGMTCNGRHGKIHESHFYIERALHELGYVKEHENVYYKKLLNAAYILPDNNFQIKYGDKSATGYQTMDFYINGKRVGGGQLQFLPQGYICYLVWVYIEDGMKSKGYGSSFMKRLFSDLASQGVYRLDTDTADSNLVAQGYYLRTGFEDMGRSRSYLRENFSNETDQERRTRIYPIVLSEYNPAWPEWFAEEKANLEHLIGTENIARISHYGSTSVPGLTAKPTVDILLEINESTDIESLIAALPESEYICLREQTVDSFDLVMFIKGYLSDGFADKVFHIHVRHPKDWDELYFRDYLIAHPETASEYAALKCRLFKDFEHNRDGYTIAKGEFIKEITKKAREGK